MRAPRHVLRIAKIGGLEQQLSNTGIISHSAKKAI
jgi:hypothetical protein